MPNIIQKPYRGAPQTVALIADYALQAQQDYDVRLLAEEICQNLAPKDYLSEILAIYNYCCGHIRYMRDPRTVELVKSPSVIVGEIKNGKTPSIDCDEFCSLLCALMLAIGCETRIVTVAFVNAFYEGNRQYSHVFCSVREPRANKWIMLDPVAGEQSGKMLKRVKAAKVWPVA